MLQAFESLFGQHFHIDRQRAPDLVEQDTADPLPMSRRVVLQGGVRGLPELGA